MALLIVNFLKFVPFWLGSQTKRNVLETCPAAETVQVYPSLTRDGKDKRVNGEGW